MRRPSLFAANSDAMDVKMTPMIDVVFLLLVFFVWTSSFQIVERLLPSDVSPAPGAPAAGEPPDTDFDPLVVRIRMEQGRPAWRLNGQLLADAAALQTRLAAVAAVHARAPVILHPDGDVPMCVVVEGYDACRLAGLEQVQLAAAAEGS